MQAHSYDTSTLLRAVVSVALRNTGASGYELVDTRAGQRPPTGAALLRPLRPIFVAHRPALHAPPRVPLPTLKENNQLQNIFKLLEN